jgi:hypothetical protein
VTQVILCVHKPRLWVSVQFDPAALEDQRLEKVTCDRCKETWNEGEREPKVIIGRIETDVSQTRSL